jgi:hypothetical protein
MYISCRELELKKEEHAEKLAKRKAEAQAAVSNIHSWLTPWIDMLYIIIKPLIKKMFRQR